MMVSLASASSYLPPPSFNPACYIPSAINNYLPPAVACPPPPPPTFFSRISDAIISPISSTYSTVRAILGTLIGLPFLSSVALLTHGGWSTTANILFFYITWSTLVLSHPPLRVELIGSLAVRLVFYVIPSLFFLAFDVLLPSAAQPFKAYAARALPFAASNKGMRLDHHGSSRGSSSSNRHHHHQPLRILAWSLANVILFAPLAQLAIELLLTGFFQTSAAVRVTTTLPAPITILKNIVQGYAIREVFTYAIHRLVLHERSHHDHDHGRRHRHDGSSSSANIAARYHQQWYHSGVAAPFPLSASYDHPLPYLLLRFLPAYLPTLLLHFHLITYLVFLLLVSVEETLAHAGYCCSSSAISVLSPVNVFFLLGGVARHADLHVVAEGCGNYGCVGFVDWVMGTVVDGVGVRRRERVGNRGGGGDVVDVDVDDVDADHDNDDNDDDDDEVEVEVAEYQYHVRPRVSARNGGAQRPPPPPRRSRRRVGAQG